MYHIHMLENIKHLEAVLETNDSINDAVIDVCLDELHHYLNALYRLGRLSQRAISAYKNGFYYSKEIEELIKLS